MLGAGVAFRKNLGFGIRSLVSVRRSEVIDEGAQLGQDLALAEMVEEDARRRGGDVVQYRSEFSRSYRVLGDRPGRLRQPDALHRGPEQRRIVMRDQRARDERVDRPVAIGEGPGRDGAISPAQT